MAGWGHTSILTDDGKVYMCGRNYQGQLGLGDPQLFPLNERGHPCQPQFQLVKALDHKRVRQVACGGEHSVMLCDDNDVFTVGANSRGQLGQGNLVACSEPKLSRPLRRGGREIFQIACGNNCTLVLAGRCQPSSLLRTTGEHIKANPALLDRLQSSHSSYSHLYSWVNSLELLDS